MGRPHIIGICGAAGAGKDALAGYMRDEFLIRGRRAFILRFASTLKAGMLAMFGVDMDSLSRADKEAPMDDLCGNSPRQVAQWLGTEFGRDMLGSDIWVNATDILIRKIPDNAVVLIPDVRFMNEVDYVRLHHGALFTVNRPGVMPVHAHSSESLPTIGLEVENDGTLFDLREKAEDIVSVLNPHYRQTEMTYAD